MFVFQNSKESLEIYFPLEKGGVLIYVYKQSNLPSSVINLSEEISIIILSGITILS